MHHDALILLLGGVAGTTTGAAVYDRATTMTGLANLARRSPTLIAFCPTDDNDYISALEHADFLREEFAKFIERKFWVVLPYELVRDLPQLQLSLAAVKDERCAATRLRSQYNQNDERARQNLRTLDRILQ